MECAVGDMFLAIDLKVSDSELGILEDGTEELLARPQPFLGPLAFGDINYRDDGPSDRSALKNWKGGIVNRDRGAIPSPDHFRVYAAALPLLARAVDGAFLDGVNGAVQLVVMRKLVHFPAQDLLGTVADQFTGSPVDERAVSLQIDTVNALTGRSQQHLHLFRETVSFFLRPFALRNVFR